MGRLFRRDERCNIAKTFEILNKISAFVVCPLRVLLFFLFLPVFALLVVLQTFTADLDENSSKLPQGIEELNDTGLPACSAERCSSATACTKTACSESSNGLLLPSTHLYSSIVEQLISDPGVIHRRLLEARRIIALG